MFTLNERRHGTGVDHGCFLQRDHDGQCGASRRHGSPMGHGPGCRDRRRNRAAHAREFSRRAGADRESAGDPSLCGPEQFPGLDQINVVVPAGISGGCKTSIAVVVNGVTGNVVSTSIAPAGQTTCGDAYGALTAANLQKAMSERVAEYRRGGLEPRGHRMTTLSPGASPRIRSTA